MDLRPISIGILLLLCSAQGFAQVKKGYKLLAKKAYPAAQLAFKKQLSHPIYAPAARTGMVQIALEQQETRLDSLYKMAEHLYRAADQWQALSAKARKKVFKKTKVDTARFRTLRITVEHLALAHFHDSSGILTFEKHLSHFPDTPSVAIFQDREQLREKMVRWHLKSVRKASYAILDALYNRNQDLLKQRGSRYPDYVYSFILDAFLKEYTYRNLATFVKEQPGHWFSEACWSDEAVDVLRQDSVQLALSFLRQRPFFILDDWIDLHINRLTGDGLLIDSIDYAPTEWAQLEELRLGWSLTKQLRSGKRQASYDQDLLRYLNITAPSKRGYDLFRMALASYQRRAAWDKANQLLLAAQRLYPDVLPPDCDKQYSFYTSKEEWFKIALDIMQRPADGISTTPLEGWRELGKEEFAPVYAPDGQALYLALANGATGLDVYVAYYDSKAGIWLPPQRVETLSSDLDDVPYGITRDGRELLLAQGGKLMMSTFGTSDWQKPFGLPLTVNQFPWVGRATLSPDGRCLIFEGSGNKKQAHELEPPFIHLYRMIKGESRFGWGNPEFMGAFVVEGGEERAPCFGPDGNLYFIADRLPSLGRGDVFVSRRINEDWKEWSAPENLGKEVNTLGDEKHWLSISPNNTNVVFATDELSKNDESHLYATALPSVAKAEKRKILTLPLGILGQNRNPSQRRELILQVKDAVSDQLLTEVKAQGEKRFIVSLPASVKKIRYLVMESPKNPVPVTKAGEYILNPENVQELPELPSN